MDVLERQSLSDVKMGKGSPICERVCKKIVEYFKNNVLQRQIAKALQISSSTVHNIIKRFRETGEIYVRKGQGRRPLLDARGLRALRWHCITHPHVSVIDITKWAQEYFQNPLLVNTMHRAICRGQLKLCHAKRNPYVNMVQKHCRVLWAKDHLKWTVSKWKSVLWSDESKFDILVENHGSHVLWAKEEGDLPACYQRSVQKPASLMVWGCISAYYYYYYYLLSAYGMGSLHVLEGTMNAERYIKVLEQHMLPSGWRVFQQDNVKPHTAAITAWLRSPVLNWHDCSPDLSPIENIWRIITQKNMWKTTTNSSAAGNLYQVRMGPNSNTKT